MPRPFVLGEVVGEPREEQISTTGRPLRGGGCLDDANLRPFFEGNLRGKKPKYCQSGS